MSVRNEEPSATEASRRATRQRSGLAVVSLMLALAIFTVALAAHGLQPQPLPTPVLLWPSGG